MSADAPTLKKFGSISKAEKVLVYCMEIYKISRLKECSVYRNYYGFIVVFHLILFLAN